MVLAKRYFKGVGSTQTSSLVTIQCFTFCTTARKHCAMFVFFSFLWSLSSHRLFYFSLWNLQIAHGNRFPWGNYPHFSFIRAIKSSVLTMFMSQRSFAFAENCFATVLSEPCASHCDCKPEYTEMTCISSWMAGKETSTKNFFFTRRKID